MYGRSYQWHLLLKLSVNWAHPAPRASPASGSLRQLQGIARVLLAAQTARQELTGFIHEHIKAGGGNTNGCFHTRSGLVKDASGFGSHIRRSLLLWHATILSASNVDGSACLVTCALA